MRCLARWIVAGCATIAAPVAFAADMPLKGPVAPPIYDWRGFYLGGNAGWGAVDPTANFNPAVLGLLLPNASARGGFIVDTAASTPPFALSFNEKGWLGGVQAGYNWQYLNWVYGLEADIEFPDLKGSASRNFTVVAAYFGDNASYAGTFGFSQAIELFGTARGRLGFAVDHWLLYATGGFAWARVEDTLFSTNFVSLNSVFPRGFPGGFAASVAGTETMYGYAVGGGLDWAITQNLWLRGEYLFIDLISNGLTLAIPGGSFSSGAFGIQIYRVGLNFRF